jgi:hypothetical protein
VEEPNVDDDGRERSEGEGVGEGEVRGEEERCSFIPGVDIESEFRSENGGEVEMFEGFGVEGRGDGRGERLGVPETKIRSKRGSVSMRVRDESRGE